MRHVAVLLLVLGGAAPVLGASPSIDVSVTKTGVSGAALSGTPTTNAIDMEDKQVTNQLALTLVITPGDSTVIDVTCYEGQSPAALEQIAKCDWNSPKSTCKPDVRQFTLSDYATVGGTKRITSRWSIKKKYAVCSVDDPNNGSGTVVLTGARSWQ